MTERQVPGQGCGQGQGRALGQGFRHGKTRGATYARLLGRAGLDRPEARGWVLYDWANSAFITTVLTAVFPVYFQDVAAAPLPGQVATARYATATTVALLVIAASSPVLGALADAAAARKRFLAAFMGLGVAATAALFLVREGDWLPALLCLVLGNIGASGSFVFYDSLLPHIAGPDELDRVSAAGYALGYLGGGLLLAVNLAWIQYPALFGIPDAATATRLSFLSVALWWLVFSIPLFRRVPEPRRGLEHDERGSRRPVWIALHRLRETGRAIGQYRQALRLLVAFVIYQDGIVTIQRMAVVYGREIGLPATALIGAILLVQFVGVPCSLLFGTLAERVGARVAILVGLSVYLGTSVLGYFMTTAWEFYLLAGLVALVQGGTQALSRSLFARLVPRHRSSEFFGFFGVFEKFAGLFGPTIFAGMIFVSGSSRNAILSLVAIFFSGGLLLARVNFDEGERAARAAEQSALDTDSGSAASK